MPDTYLLKKPDDPAGDAPAGETPREGASTGNGASGPSANAPAASSGQQPAAATQVSVPDAAGSQQATTSPATGANAAAQQKAKPSPLPAEPGLRQAWRVAGRMVDNFWRKAEAVWPGGRRPAPGELKRWVILASIVEKETAVEAERPRVAGVYANRLAKGMLLQADPTVIYGLGQKFSGRLLYKHLDDATNPYNTYQRPGLTPGPICSFGASALGAAVKPETHAYLYFVAKPDGSGAHVFSTNLDAHNRAVREYREKRRGEKR
ncbi:MAG: endolytic transglycosylase MltG [Desulfovibrio sp.]|nr:endolytic transglycosylase MltG [Desulfovibrio sp.]